MTTEILLLRGQGADDTARPHSDAGGFAKRQHAQVTVDGQTLKSPSWWMGCQRDQQAARDTVAAAADAADLREKMWA